MVDEVDFLLRILRNKLKQIHLYAYQRYNAEVTQHGRQRNSRQGLRYFSDDGSLVIRNMLEQF